ncbi:NAD-dependent epimerase/dehydratase family protein [Glaciecola siphonariae]|uniref:NAD-dependent epimerase/dehydratase family protein n=1 Tax=Glaciecola siphonariae TaxID=521012 RepID=A0ABV9LWU0_9ALTE
MQTIKTILVTGATGFLGSHLLTELLSANYSVVILTRNTTDFWRIHDVCPRVKNYVIGEQSIQSIFEANRIDLVVHLATCYRKATKSSDVADMVETNITFPLELLEVGVSNGLKAFINTGTFFEYDCRKLPVTEDAPLSAFNLYAKTKTAFECLLKTYSDKILINTFRLFTPFGEKDNNKLVPFVIKQALSRQTINLSEGFQKLDFIYVKDIVGAYIRAVQRFNTIEHQNEYELFNLGSGSALSIRDVISEIERSLSMILNVKWGARSESDIPIAFADISKAQVMLDWSPSFSIQDGINRTVSYYRDSNANK